MRKILMAMAFACFVVGSASATPLLPVSTATHALVHEDEVIQIRHQGKARPYGWSKGRKVGWRGRSLPPGQAKKFR
jgi:hypothetical protein